MLSELLGSAKCQPATVAAFLLDIVTSPAFLMDTEYSALQFPNACLAPSGLDTLVRTPVRVALLVAEDRR